MNKREDFTGKKFSRLLVLSFGGKNKREERIWNCQCDCGVLVVTTSRNLTHGVKKSCGCLRLEKATESVLKHGKSGSSEYNAWANMRQRCCNPKNNRYINYGARGIKVCDRWLSSFENFLEDMGSKPSIAHSLDRHPNVDGDYTPENCRWGTDEQQSRGRTDNIYFEHNGIRMVQRDWEKRWGIVRGTLYRLIKSGKMFVQIYNKYEVS